MSNNSTFKYDKDMIQWRRDIVLLRLAHGYTHAEIGKELQVHRSTISLDSQYWQLRAREEVKDFIEKLPLMLLKSTMALNSISTKTLQLIEQASDIKTKFQGLALLKDIEKQKVELYSSTDIIDQLVGAIEKRKEQVTVEQQQENKQLEDNRLSTIVGNHIEEEGDSNENEEA